MEKKSEAEVGPLFVGVAKIEPETIWDDNDENPANEAHWLAYFDKHEADITASESTFVTEYKRRRALTAQS